MQGFGFQDSECPSFQDGGLSFECLPFLASEVRQGLGFGMSDSVE